jgi:hypothetical protein
LTQTEIQSQKESQQGIDLSEIDQLCDRLWQIAQTYKDDPRELLSILRTLEKTHQDIRDELFQPALPISRHELFNLLRDIETNGGWPHIYRMKINEICRYLEQTDEMPNN